MEYICRICGKLKRKSSFTEKAFANHTCKDCKVLHHLKTEDHDQLDEIFDLFTQSRISKNDTDRLKILSNSKHPKVSLQATLVLEVAQIRPYKRGRQLFLEQNHPELTTKLEEAGFIYAPVAKRERNRKYQKTQY